MEWIRRELNEYLLRIATALRRTKDLPNSSLRHIFDSFVGSFIGILILSYLDQFWLLERSDVVMIVGSFGAQAILIFVTPTVPLAQPWNCIVGNFVGATIGVTSFKFFKMMVDDVEAWIWIASAVAVSLAIVVMLLTKSLHPPAGATALIAVQGSQRIHDLGYYYVLFPAVVASTLQVLIGVILNNLSKDASRSYPQTITPFHIDQIGICCSGDVDGAPSPPQISQVNENEEKNSQDYLEEIEEEFSLSGLELASAAAADGMELVPTVEV
jgi:CBS-domain-containing membrane protein